MSVSRTTTRRRAGRSAFTLIEMLIVMLIIALLVATMAVVYVGAAEKGKEARTRSEIAKIDQLLRARWESYQTRRVPLVIPPNVARDRVNFAKMRLDALRDLQRMELPDRKTDVTDGPAFPIMPEPALHRAYQRMATSKWTTEHQGAECLYMILKTIQDGETTGLEFFHQDEIGDTDGDGMPEILDAWGTPIRFLRWAPGFRSPLQDGDPEKSPDPFDPLDVYGGFRLYPLVISAGPDKGWDIAFDTKTPVRYKTLQPPSNPYYKASDGTQIGRTGPDIDDKDGGATYIDNIHNHLLGTRVH